MIATQHYEATSCNGDEQVNKQKLLPKSIHNKLNINMKTNYVTLFIHLLMSAVVERLSSMVQTQQIFNLTSLNYQVLSQNSTCWPNIVFFFSHW